MISNIFQYIKLFIIFLPFMLFQYLNKRANFKKEVRYKQFIMPIVSLVYFVLMFGFISKFRTAGSFVPILVSITSLR